MKLKRLIILLILIGGIIITFSACSPTVTVNVNSQEEVTEQGDDVLGTEAEPIKASLMIDHQDGTVKTFEAEITDKTVFGLTKKVAEDNDISFSYDSSGEQGVFIKEIDGVSNSSDKFWQFWVNNTFGDRAADHYEISEGAVVEWKYIQSQF